MAKPSSFPVNAPGTGQANLTEAFPPEGAVVDPPVAPETPPVDLGAEPSTDPATGLPMLPVDDVLKMSGLEKDDLPGQLPNEDLDGLLFGL